MTGTGTQNDPFIPENWDELKNAAETAGAYVRLPSGAEWDMNDQYPEGVPSIGLLCAELDGNGSVIKNIRMSGGGGVFVRANVDGYSAVRNLTFDNVYISGDSKMFDFQNTFYSRIIVFDNVRISRTELYNSTLFNLIRDYVNCQGCSIAVWFSEGVFGGDYLTCVDTSINIEGTVTASGFGALSLKSSEVTGEVRSVGQQGSILINSNSDVSIFDISLLNYSDVYYSGNNPVLCNISKTGGATVSANLIQATEAQMKDADWLHDHGFPCGRG